MRFSAWTLSICRDNLFLSSYMPCSVHFVENRLLTNDILRLAISILFVSCRGQKGIETSQLFRTQNNSRNSTSNCNFLNIYQETLFINLPFFKAYQRYATAYCLPILCQILVYHIAGMSRLRDTEQEVQCTSNWKLTVQFKQAQTVIQNYPSLKLSRLRTSRFLFFIFQLIRSFFSRDPTLATSRIFFYSFWSLFLKVSQCATNSIETIITVKNNL